MAMASSNHENGGCFGRLSGWLEAAQAKVVDVARRTKKLGQDDPRRIIHSLKAGLTLTIVCLFYYFDPIQSFYGVNAMWAVLTVVVVFEFSVGATLGKGLNRMLATLGAGALGFGVNCLASNSGATGKPVLIAISVFTIAAAATFTRFFPWIKARYDYGLVIFILTFSLVSVSGYRDDDILEIAHQRLSTIIIGCCVAMLVNICIYPVWIGEDLHNLVAINIEKLGNFLEGFGDEYFTSPEHRLQDGDKSFLQGYKSVLTSQSSEENMANLARWEPGHGRFKFRHPWKQYLKIATLARQCAYKIEVLSNYLNSSIQTPMEIRVKIQEPCTEISSECGKALKDSASSIKKMIHADQSGNVPIGNSKRAGEVLKAVLKTSLWEEETDLLDVIPAAAVASLLLEVIECTEKIIEAFHELASLASFKNINSVSLQQSQGSQQVHSVDIQNHVITIGE